MLDSEVSLSVKLGDAPPYGGVGHVDQPYRSNNGPARQRRHVKRAAAREAVSAAAEEARAEPNVTVEANKEATEKEEEVTVEVVDIEKDKSDSDNASKPKSKTEIEDNLETLDYNIYVFHYSDKTKKAEALNIILKDTK